MKKLLLVILTFLNINFISAQNGQWSNIISLSDSLHDNQNFDLVNAWYEISPWYFSDSIFFAWEQVIDDSTTQILIKNFHSQNIPTPILHQTGVQFKNPKFMPMREYTSGKESVFYLFYESNQNGNIDIYYLKYFVDKTFSQPIPFAVSSVNEKDLETGTMNVVWQSADTIFNSRLNSNFNWTQPDVIDSGNCYLPVISNEDLFISWLKSSNDSFKIHFKEWDFQNYQWSDDSLLFDKGSSSNITFGNISNQAYLPILSWQNVKDSTSQIFFWNVSGNREILKLDTFLNLNKHEPSHFITSIPINESWAEYPLTVFVLDTAGRNQIMGNDYFIYSTNFQNLSGNSFINRKPELFEGEWYGYYLKVYLVWESFQNNHWQLKMRSISFNLSSVKDEQMKFISDFELFQNYPNPFNLSTNIEYHLSHSSKVELRIFDILGKEVNTIVNKRQSAGNYRIQWDGKDKKGNDVANGLYLYFLKTDNLIKSKKMLLIK